MKIENEIKILWFFFSKQKISKCVRNIRRKKRLLKKQSRMLACPLYLKQDKNNSKWQ